jgi:hypothetical protein
LLATFLFGMAAAVAGCEDDDAAHARKRLRQQHVPALRSIVEKDKAQHLEGVEIAAERLAGGFAIEDPEVRERQLRSALEQVQMASASPKVRIRQLVVSPMGFLAAIDDRGRVIARDADPDPMKGEDFSERYDVVRKALEDAETGYGLGEFAGTGGSESSWSMLFAAPVRREGEVVGAVLAGIPLWRMAQRLSRQLRLEHANEIGQGLVLWAYLYKGDRLFHFGTPPELDEVVPDASTRQAGLRKNPDGFTGAVQVHGRTYGYAVAPMEAIGPDCGVIAFRADAPE